MTDTKKNSIIVVGGANKEYPKNQDGSYVLPNEWLQAIKQSDVLLMQREVPEYVNIAAAQAAN